jgi:HAE1 family hydrophobic/amphiphilic exporter-1
MEHRKPMRSKPYIQIIVLLGVSGLAAPPASGQARFSTVALQAALREAGAQAPPGAAAQPAAAAAPAAPRQGEPQTLRLTVEEAIKLALEYNLGIQIARYDPQVEDLNIVQAQAGWSPSLTNTTLSTSVDSPNNSFLAGGQGLKTSDDRVVNTMGIQQTTKWGTQYSVGWDGSRMTTNNAFTTFSPQLRSSLAMSVSQPLLRNLSVDAIRNQVQQSLKNREIADVDVRRTVALTLRNVRNAYWNLAYAHASLRVQQQSLELAQESLRNTRSRVEIGTTPPIDVVEAESEVAQRDEAVIVSEAQIQTAEDALRTLILDPNSPSFWTTHLEAVDPPLFQTITVDVDAAVRNALDKRTDLQQSVKSMELNDVNIRYLRNQTLPEVTASFDYGLTGLGGTFLQRGVGPFGPGTGAVVGATQRGFGTVLGDLFSNDYPNWTAQLNISYPIGTSPSEAGLARARLQRNQIQTQLRDRQLQVATQVREAARQVQTNQKRVESTRVSRSLAERRLDAEERKLAAGTSTSFVVFQTQRDLAVARNNELRAVLDFNQSVVDLETVQEIPLASTAPVLIGVQ